MSQREFNKRISERYEELKELYLSLYEPLGGSYKDFNRVSKKIESYYENRRAYLRKIDINEKNWYQDPSTIAYSFSPSYFYKNLIKTKVKADYLLNLGVNTLHIDFDSQTLESLKNDIVGNHSEIEILESIELFTESMKRLGFYSSLKVNINSLSNDSIYYKQALEGVIDSQKIFILVDDLAVVRNYDRCVPFMSGNETLSNFKFDETLKKYVFSSNGVDNDLNYKNPVVFEMLVDYILTLANNGINLIILDQCSVLWKQVGTNSHNRAEVHVILEMLNIIKDIVCPSLVIAADLKEDQQYIPRYFGTDRRNEVSLVVNHSLITNVFNSLATRDTRMLSIDSQRTSLPHNGAWINYIRTCEPVFWNFNEAAALALRWDPENHKQFLISFFSGEFDGSFSKGIKSGYNVISNDAGINGRLASLIGLEKAVNNQERYEIENSIRRIILLHSIILSERGVPMLYFGDEFGQKSNFQKISGFSSLNQKLNYSTFDWPTINSLNSTENRIFQEIQQLISIRKNEPLLNSKIPVTYVTCTNHSLSTYYKKDEDNQFVVICNFSEHPQTLNTIELKQHGLRGSFIELVQNRYISLDNYTIHLHPYEFMWLKSDKKIQNV